MKTTYFKRMGIVLALTLSGALHVFSQDNDAARDFLKRMKDKKENPAPTQTSAQSAAEGLKTAAPDNAAVVKIPASGGVQIKSFSGNVEVKLNSCIADAQGYLTLELILTNNATDAVFYPKRFTAYCDDGDVVDCSYYRIGGGDFSCTMPEGIPIKSILNSRSGSQYINKDVKKINLLKVNLKVNDDESEKTIEIRNIPVSWE